jgi:hypothetical protein
MILINAGQCGNQLGYCLIDSVYNHLHENQEELEYFFRKTQSNELISRSICLDTEPKVIHECIQQSIESTRWLYDARNMLYQHGGAGNNWALGFEMYSGKFKMDSLERIRYELEMCDLPSSLLVVHSVGGGTGSGLGTSLTETIADEARVYTYMCYIDL